MLTRTGYTCSVENVTGPLRHCFSSLADMAMNRAMERMLMPGDYVSMKLNKLFTINSIRVKNEE